MRYENETLMAKLTLTNGSQVWKEIMQNMVQETEDNILTTETEVRDLFYLFADDLDEEWTVAELEYSAHPLNGKGNDVCITTMIER
jgi:L-rhamnose mutarotase